MKSTLKLVCAALVAGGIALPAVTYALNPQPEPPAPAAKKKIESPATKTGINPQPEPPNAVGKKPVNPVVKKGINPQPEPPGDKLSAPAAAGGAAK
jgi:hypothetical protein